MISVYLKIYKWTSHCLNLLLTVIVLLINKGDYEHNWKKWWRHLEPLWLCCSPATDMGFTVERHWSVTRLSFRPAFRIGRLPLAASLLNGQPLLKPSWSDCVSQPAVPLLEQPLGLVTRLQQGWEVTDHQEREDIIGRTNSLCSARRTKTLICPCPDLSRLFLHFKKYMSRIWSASWLYLAITSKLIQ